MDTPKSEIRMQGDWHPMLHIVLPLITKKWKLTASKPE